MVCSHVLRLYISMFVLILFQRSFFFIARARLLLLIDDIIFCLARVRKGQYCWHIFSSYFFAFVSSTSSSFSSYLNMTLVAFVCHRKLQIVRNDNNNSGGSGSAAATTVKAENRHIGYFVLKCVSSIFFFFKFISILFFFFAENARNTQDNGAQLQQTVIENERNLVGGETATNLLTELVTHTWFF